MVGLLRWIASKVSQHWEAVSWAAGVIWSAIGGGVMAWAAYATNMFAAYAPASWVGAGFLGCLVSAAIFWLVARSQHWLAQAKWTRTFASPGDGINPLDDNFVRKRIKINDFVSPAHAWVQGKTFDRCELIGPSPVMFDRGNIVNPLFFDCNFICVKNNVTIHNAIKFEGCSFIGCRIYKCEIFVPVSASSA